MRYWSLMVVPLILGASVAGCRGKPVTEADLQQAIQEHQTRTNSEIERTVQAAPPPYTKPDENAPSSSPSSNNNPPGTMQPTPGLEIPPPNSYSGSPSYQETPHTPPPSNGDLKLDPQTGQYGIHPPGAPETYTIPLDKPLDNPN